MQRRDGARAREGAERGGAGRWSLAAAGDSGSLRLLGKKAPRPQPRKRREAAADKNSPAFPRGAWKPELQLERRRQRQRRLRRLLERLLPKVAPAPAPSERAVLTLPASREVAGRSPGGWIAFRYSEGKTTGEVVCVCVCVASSLSSITLPPPKAPLATRPGGRCPPCRGPTPTTCPVAASRG